jgi:hypothetical protein
VNQIGKFMILIGGVLILTGGVFLLVQRFWGDKPLPGTLRIEIGNTTLFIPILASIIASVVLTLLLNLIGRFLAR